MLRDLQWALRSLSRNPRFTGAVVAILALAIGANTAVFSIVDAVLLRVRPYQMSGRLVRIQETKNERPIAGVSADDYLRWRDRGDLFARSAGILRDSFTVTGAGEPDQVIVQRVSPGLFAMLGERAQLGRTLAPSDEQDPHARTLLPGSRDPHRLRLLWAWMELKAIAVPIEDQLLRRHGQREAG